MNITAITKDGEIIIVRPGQDRMGVYTASDGYCRLWFDRPHSDGGKRTYITPPYDEPSVRKILNLEEFDVELHVWRECDMVYQERRGTYGDLPNPGEIVDGVSKIETGSIWGLPGGCDNGSDEKPIDSYYFKTPQEINATSLKLREKL